MQQNKSSGAEAVVRELRSRMFELQKDFEEEKVRRASTHAIYPHVFICLELV